MGLEQDITRIAESLEKIAGLQEQMLGVAGANQERLAARAAAAPPTVAEAEAEADATIADRKAREEEYNALKEALITRGVEIPPRTKLTTLQKLWEQHKDAPVAPAEEVGEAPEGFRVAEAPADSWKPSDSPAEEVPAATAPMTREEARASITAWYKSTPEDQQILIDAFAEVGATKFTEVKDGDFGRLIAIINRLRGDANA
jgi:hypothetical protein